MPVVLMLLKLSQAQSRPDIEFQGDDFRWPSASVGLLFEFEPMRKVRDQPSNFVTVESVAGLEIADCRGDGGARGERLVKFVGAFG